MKKKQANDTVSTGEKLKKQATDTVSTGKNEKKYASEKIYGVKRYDSGGEILV